MNNKIKCYPITGHSSCKHGLYKTGCTACDGTGIQKVPYGSIPGQITTGVCGWCHGAGYRWEPIEKEGNTPKE